MQIIKRPIVSVWQQLKNGIISCKEALELLVNENGFVNLDLLDSDVRDRFLRTVRDRRTLPPVIPLLFWRNCYYLGSPVEIQEEEIQKMSDRTLTNINIIPITENGTIKVLKFAGKFLTIYL